MKLATFEKEDQRRLGAVLDGNTHLLDLTAAHQANTGVGLTLNQYLEEAFTWRS